MTFPFRLIPLILIISVLTFAVRVGEVMTGFKTITGSAVAEEKKPDDTKPDDPKKDASDQPEQKKGESAPKPDSKKEPDKTPKRPTAEKWPDPTDIDPELQQVRQGLVKDLAVRRDIIEKQEKALATREAMLRASEDELDQKLQEMSSLREQIKTLLNQQSQEEMERIKSLVRIYEGMKPADAARIFNTLDTTILLDVMTRMSERKSAPVLAAMDADRARMITIMMAQQKKLPDLPDINGADTGAP